MGKENTRTLKNFNGKKKSSKKYSKSRKNRNDTSTSEEMRDILNSDSEMPANFMSKNNRNLVQYEGDMPQMGMQQMPQMGMPQMPQMGMPQMGMPNMGMPSMNMPNMGMQQMFSPTNYDPIMLQSVAPVQSMSAFQQAGMPNNLMTPSSMASGMGGYAHSGAPTVPQFQMPSMTGGGLYRNIPRKRLVLTRKLL